jgi:hypothetical protein
LARSLRAINDNEKRLLIVAQLLSFVLVAIAYFLQALLSGTTLRQFGLQIEQIRESEQFLLARHGNPNVPYLPFNSDPKGAVPQRNPTDFQIRLPGYLGNMMLLSEK